MRWIYTGIIQIIWWLTSPASLFLTRVRLFRKSRKAEAKNSFKPDKQSGKTALIHCASLGEYLMAEPLIKTLKQRDFRIVVSFFSPSGYNQVNKPDLIDYKCYLPIDLPKNVSTFLDQFKPDLFVFVKYDFWFNLMFELEKRHIKTWLVNGLLRENHLLLKSWARPLSRYLTHFQYLFLQNDASAKLLSKSFGETMSKKCVVTGDIRFDQVRHLRKNNSPIERISEWKGEQKVLIAGSSWPEEEVILLNNLPSLIKWGKILMAPHDVNDDHILRLKTNLVKAGYKVNLWSDEAESDADILIINTIGILSRAYQYGEIAMIGGGFGRGLHNILEAVNYHMPVITGPKIERFPEALRFRELGVLFPVEDVDQFTKTFQKLTENPEVLTKIAGIAEEEMSRHLGALDKIVERL